MMGTELSRKIVAISVCLGFCVFAQARGQESDPRLHDLRPLDQRVSEPLMSESRLPGEPPPFAFKWGTDGAGDDQFHYPWGVTIDA